MNEIARGETAIAKREIHEPLYSVMKINNVSDETTVVFLKLRQFLKLKTDHLHVPDVSYLSVT